MSADGIPFDIWRHGGATDYNLLDHIDLSGAVKRLSEEIDGEIIKDALRTGVGVSKDGERISPEDFYTTKEEDLDER